MFNPLNFIKKFIKSSNQQELDRISKIVDKINSLEENFKGLKDEELPKKTIELKKELKTVKHLIRFCLKLLVWLGKLLEE